MMASRWPSPASNLSYAFVPWVSSSCNSTEHAYFAHFGTYHVALEHPVAKLVCFGYPLQAAGNSAKIRDQVLIELETPILFVQGSRDALCPLELLARVRQRMRAPSKLFVVDAADHSLQVTKTQLKQAGEDQAAVDARILHVVGHFTRDTPGASAAP